MTKRKSSMMDDVWADVCKAFGTDGIFEDEREIMSTAETISTGSLALDEATGVWGLPMGRIIQFAGRESSGKSLLSLMTIREWQRMDPKNWAVYIDAEFAFDPNWAEMLGVDLGRLKRRKLNRGTDIMEFLCGVPHKELGKKKVKPGLLDWIIERGGARETGLGIIVIDSVASILPPIEETSASGKATMAPMGRFMSTELRKLTPLLGRSGTMLIAINQVRVQPGVMYGDPETSPGGSAWKHNCSVMVHLACLIGSDYAIKDADDVMIGHRIRARIDKNRVGPPFRKCDFDIKYTEGIVNAHVELADLAVKHGVIQRSTNVTYTYGDQVITKHGKDKFLESIETGRFESGEASYDPAELRRMLLKDIRQACAGREGAAEAVPEKTTEES
jgi:recombination protein RecA